jgi:hypothetical protein
VRVRNSPRCCKPVITLLYNSPLCKPINHGKAKGERVSQKTCHKPN